MRSSSLMATTDSLSPRRQMTLLLTTLRPNPGFRTPSVPRVDRPRQLRYCAGMWWIVLIVVIVLVLVLALKGSAQAKPKLPVFPAGAELGRWKVGYHPDMRAVSLRLDLPEAERARFVVFRVH